MHHTIAQPTTNSIDALYSQEKSDLLPREKALALGIDQLNDLELLQSILGAGIKGRPVQELARQVLSYLSHEPNGPSLERLCQLQGIGSAKAILICSAVELCRRLYFPRKTRIQKPEDVWQNVRHFADREQEHFLCLTLNGAHELIKVCIVTVGLVNKTMVHPREVFAPAIIDRATSLMVAHNHPSGNLEPSAEDIAVTNRLRMAGETLGIQLLDHLIFSKTAYLSFKERELL